MFYNDRVKYLINYKEEVINVVLDYVFGSGYSINF